MKKVELRYAGIPYCELVDKTNDPSLLAQMVTDADHAVTRRDAAAKLVKMWTDNEVGVTRVHLCSVADHGDEPHRSEANRLYYAEALIKT